MDNLLLITGQVREKLASICLIESELWQRDCKPTSIRNMLADAFKCC